MINLKYVLPAICLATLALSSAAARADGLNLSPYLGQTVSMTVQPYASGENNGPFYVGLTDVDLATGGTAIGSIEAFCDDFTHEISVPDTYNVVVTAVAGNTAYEQAAYYGSLFGSTPSGNSTVDSEIQELIWNLTAPGTYTLNSYMTTLQSQMLANYSNVDYSNDFYFDAGNNGQSFMDVGPAPTPEPPTLLTLATGLIGMAFFVRRQATVKA